MMIVMVALLFGKSFDRSERWQKYVLKYVRRDR